MKNCYFANRIIKNKLLPFLKIEGMLPETKTIFGWGRKNSGELAKNKAMLKGFNSVFVEDGFIKSTLLKTKTQLSIVSDKLGIYYDARDESELEHIIKTTILTDEETQNTRSIINDLLKNNISKYNHSQKDIEIQTTNNLLIIDQVNGDLSLKYGFASKTTTLEMIETARAEHPEKNIYLKVHPEVISGKKEGGINPENIPDYCSVIDNDVNPIKLLRHFDYVYTRTSQMGFEALLLNKHVVCFGIPFYAYWGLTDDRVIEQNAKSRRNKEKTLEEVFYASYQIYTKYIDDRTKEKSDIQSTITQIKEEKKCAGVIEADSIVVGFSLRKYFELKRFVGKNIKLIYIPKKLPTSIQIKLAEFYSYQNKNIIIWGKYNSPIKNDKKLISVEDGFIRSKGLGSLLKKPYSWTFDDIGIYYDATKPSKLENTLNSYELDDEDKKRASNILESIIDSGISKYGLKSNNEELVIIRALVKDETRKIIFVPGQVPTDASIKYGAIGEVKSNLDLIKKIKEENPEAVVIYKVHPDLTAKGRKQDSDEEQIKELADYYIKNVSVLDLMNLSDEIHTITSLTGFEGLIRDKKVVCYGSPFYSGWGLTTDKINIVRRTKTRTKEDLLFISLDLYPSYVDLNGKIITVENIIEKLK